MHSLWLSLVAVMLCNASAFAVEGADTLKLLRISAADLLAKQGPAEKSTADGTDEVNYTFANGLQVWVMKDEVVSYAARGESTFKTSDGIGLGSSLDEVTTAFGALSTSDEAADWSHTEKPGVLYHVASVDQYKVTYHTQNVSFLFNSEKKVILIMISDCFVPEE